MTYDKLEKKRIKMHAFRRAYGNICKMPTSPKTLSKKRVCYQLKNYQDAGQVFRQSPNIRTLRQLGFRKTKRCRENYENVSHMEIQRGIKMKKKYQAFTCQMLGISNREEKEAINKCFTHITFAI